MFYRKQLPVTICLTIRNSSRLNSLRYFERWRKSVIRQWTVNERFEKLIASFLKSDPLFPYFLLLDKRVKQRFPVQLELEVLWLLYSHFQAGSVRAATQRASMARRPTTDCAFATLATLVWRAVFNALGKERAPTANVLAWGHGGVSAAVVLFVINLTKQEVFCIRFALGRSRISLFTKRKEMWDL